MRTLAVFKHSVALVCTILAVCTGHQQVHMQPSCAGRQSCDSSHTKREDRPLVASIAVLFSLGIFEELQGRYSGRLSLSLLRDDAMFVGPCAHGFLPMMLQADESQRGNGLQSAQPLLHSEQTASACTKSCPMLLPCNDRACRQALTERAGGRGRLTQSLATTRVSPSSRPWQPKVSCIFIVSQSTLGSLLISSLTAIAVFCGRRHSARSKGYADERTAVLLA